MSERTFVEIIFPKEVEQTFKQLIKLIVPKEQLYYSPVVPHIKGNMSGTLHSTVFFGLKNEKRNDVALQSLISNYNLKELELGELFFIEGYENLYRVLCIKVIDKNNKLIKLSKQVEEFITDEDFQPREFKPHITLCYVTKDYVLPQELLELPLLLKIAKIQVTTISEFQQRIDNAEKLKDIK